MAKFFMRLELAPELDCSNPETLASPVAPEVSRSWDRWCCHLAALHMGDGLRCRLDSVAQRVMED